MTADRASGKGQGSIFSLAGWRARRAAQAPRSARVRLLWLLRTGIWGVLLFLGLGLLIQHVLVVSQGPTDFCQDYFAAGRALAGMPVYQPLHCWAGIVRIPTALEYDSHPPTAVLLFLPFGPLPRMPAALLWGLCSLAAYLVSGVLLLEAVGWRSLRGMALFVVGSVLWEPVTVSETVQNVWEVLTLLLVLAWIQERRGRSGWSGGLVGLAGLLKIWPAALLAGAVLWGRWRLVLVGSLMLGLGTGLALLVLGADAFGAYLGPVAANEGVWVPSAVNVSLVSAVARPLAGYSDAAYVVAPLASGVPLSQAVLLGEVAAGLLLVATLVFLWRCRHASRGEPAALFSRSLLLTVLLLVFPISWRWGLITLLLPCAMLLIAERQLSRRSWWQRCWLWIGLAPLLLRQAWVVAVADWLTPQAPGLISIWFGLPTLGLLLFAGMQAWLLWRACAPTATRLVPSLETAAPEGGSA